MENLGRIVDHQERTIATLSREVDLHSKALGWRLQQRLIPLRKSLLAVPVVRQIYRAFYRALEIWVDEGFLQIFSRAGHKVSLALRGRNFLVEGRGSAGSTSRGPVPSSGCSFTGCPRAGTRCWPR